MVESKTAFTNQSNAPAVLPEVRAICLKHICLLKAEIAEIDAKMDKIIASEPGLSRMFKIIRAVKGFGDCTARLLVANLTELGHVNRRRIASLAGLARHPHQSGESNWKRPMAGGRIVIKNAMFIVALSASRYNERLSQVYSRLLANSKSKKTALFAVARQMVTYINFLVSEQFLPTTQTTG
ncbi:MAG: transposase [Candidatus Symbiobacter sp.]|nr:transposase [Candidatus Symbiobacter sp.]